MKAIDNSAEWVLFPSYISWKNKVFKKKRYKRFQYSSKENIVDFKPDKFKLSLTEDNQTVYRWQLPTNNKVKRSLFLKNELKGDQVQTSDALLLKQMRKKQTRFVSVLNQNQSDLFFMIEN